MVQATRSQRRHIVILGGSFAGLTAAFDLKRELRDSAEVTVVSKGRRFVFTPSLIWVVPGWRRPEQITFELQPALAKHGIGFVQGTAERVDPDAKKVYLDSQAGGRTLEYDYLVVATGAHIDFDAVPGVGPHGGYTTSICTLEHSLEAREKWQELLRNPGPVIIGATQGASCFGAAYEFLFNADYALRKAGLRGKAPITYVTAEPFVGHFGMGGVGRSEALTRRFLKRQGIEAITNAVIREVTPEAVILEDGRRLPYRFAMLIPPFSGADVVKNSPDLGNERGFIPVTGEYRHVRYPEVYAAGVAIAVQAPEKTPVPTGVPKTGYMSEVMAKIAARNISADIRAGAPGAAGTAAAHGQRARHGRLSRPFADIDALCIMDAGNMGIIMVLDRIFGKRKRELLLPGPWSHWAKIAFEKYFLWKMRGGRTYLK